MKHLSRSVFTLLVLFTLSLSVFCEETVWIRGTFEEKNSSPLIGSATVPLELTKAVVAAIPKQFLEELEYSGFDMPVLLQAVEALPVGDIFELNEDDYHLKIEKYTTNDPQPARSNLLLIRLDEPDGPTRIPVPLSITSAAIPLLQYALKELKGMEEPLAKVIEEVRKTAPGLVFVGEDQFTDTTLEIKLQ